MDGIINLPVVRRGYSSTGCWSGSCYTRRLALPPFSSLLWSILSWCLADVDVTVTALATVGGIVGLAADPDFTENLLMRYLPKAKIDEIYTKGVATIAWGEVCTGVWCRNMDVCFTPHVVSRHTTISFVCYLPWFVV